MSSDFLIVRRHSPGNFSVEGKKVMAKLGVKLCGFSLNFQQTATCFIYKFNFKKLFLSVNQKRIVLSFGAHSETLDLVSFFR